MVLMPTGMCKLCLQQRRLQESHLLPRALYRLARGSGTRGNQDPVAFTAKGSRSSSHQLKDYVLCRECEQLFSKKGEDYVMRLVTKRNGQFPLLEKLRQAPTKTKRGDWSAYSATETPEIDRATIAYFALSVFWRASVHSWRDVEGDRVKIDLGTRYNEELRRYLLGEAHLPKNAWLLVSACSDNLSQQIFFMPSENAVVNDRTVGFAARGIVFTLHMTKTPTTPVRRLSMTNTAHSWIVAADCQQQELADAGN